MTVSGSWTRYKQQILTAQEKEAELSLQLSQTSPNLITQSGDLTDVATVRAKLTEAEQRYTPEHPEVKRLKRALETLMAQNGTGNKLNANNPQYLMTETELKGTRNSLAGLKAQADQISAKLERSRAWVEETPMAEREISEVAAARKEVLQNEYQRTQDRLQSANLAQTFESQQGGERFSMVREPTAASSPVFPNRLGLILARPRVRRGGVTRDCRGHCGKVPTPACARPGRACYPTECPCWPASPSSTTRSTGAAARSRSRPLSQLTRRSYWLMASP